MADYLEVRSNYHDNGKTFIDAWKTMDDEEEGEVVAYVHDDGRVEWVNDDARESKLVNEEIQSVLKELN